MAVGIDVVRRGSPGSDAELDRSSESVTQALARSGW